MSMYVCMYVLFGALVHKTVTHGKAWSKLYVIHCSALGRASVGFTSLEFWKSRICRPWTDCDHWQREESVSAESLTLPRSSPEWRCKVGSPILQPVRPWWPIERIMNCFHFLNRCRLVCVCLAWYEFSRVSFRTLGDFPAIQFLIVNILTVFLTLLSGFEVCLSFWH